MDEKTIKEKKLRICLDYFVQEGVLSREEKKYILDIISKKRIVINNSPLEDIDLLDGLVN